MKEMHVQADGRLVRGVAAVVGGGLVLRVNDGSWPRLSRLPMTSGFSWPVFSGCSGSQARFEDFLILGVCDDY